MDLENLLSELRNEIVNSLDSKSQKIHKNLKFAYFLLNVDSELNPDILTPDELNIDAELSYLYKDGGLDLHIRGLGLKEFPSFLKEKREYFKFFLESLYSLDLNDNKISAIPKVMNQFENLIWINLIGNELKEFSFPIISNLQFLILYGNKIKKCNVYLDNFTNLKLLDLRYNKMREINFTNSDKNSLGILYLSNNELEKIPKNFELLQNLEFLTLNMNPLRKIEVDFTELKNLKEITIDKKQMKLLTTQQVSDLSDCNCRIKIL